jgi:hypothetical protein
LPDGLFSNQKSKFGHISEGLRNENVGIFDSHLIYLISGQLVIFFTFWYVEPRKIWQTFAQLTLIPEAGDAVNADPGDQRRRREAAEMVVPGANITILKYVLAEKKWRKIAIVTVVAI